MDFNVGTKRHILALVGSFPPPTTGAAKNNLVLYDDLIAAGANVIKLDTSGAGTGHRRGLRYHFERIAQNVRVAIGLLRIRSKGSTFYIVPDAGHGAAYSLVHVLLGRILFPRLVIHHRSFRYIDNTTMLMSAIVRISSRNALHVFLSEGMGKRFEEVYGCVNRITVSNAHYVANAIVSSPPPRRAPSLVIGHLSNLCWAKGFYDVIDVFERLATSGVDVKLMLAGPPIDADVQAEIDRLETEWPDQFSYVGPIYGDAKHQFYRQLDVFLFPTHHDQEAQPNVIYEALAAGAAVLATPRGCIPEMLIGVSGEVSPTESDYPAWCESSLRQFVRSTDIGRSLAQLEVEVQRSREAYEMLLDRLVRG